MLLYTLDDVFQEDVISSFTRVRIPTLLGPNRREESTFRQNLRVNSSGAEADVIYLSTRIPAVNEVRDIIIGNTGFRVVVDITDDTYRIRIPVVGNNLPRNISLARICLFVYMAINLPLLLINEQPRRTPTGRRQV